MNVWVIWNNRLECERYIHEWTAI